MTGTEIREWKCDNCGAWNPDDGTGNDHEGYTCQRCDSCMYPEELARFFADGDPEAKMTWRTIEHDDKKMPCPKTGRCSAKRCPLKGQGIPYILTTFDGTPCQRQFGGQ